MRIIGDIFISPASHRSKSNKIQEKGSSEDRQIQILKSGSIYIQNLLKKGSERGLFLNNGIQDDHVESGSGGGGGASIHLKRSGSIVYSTSSHGDRRREIREHAQEVNTELVLSPRSIRSRNKVSFVRLTRP